MEVTPKGANEMAPSSMPIPGVDETVPGTMPIVRAKEMPFSAMTMPGVDAMAPSTMPMLEINVTSFGTMAGQHPHQWYLSRDFNLSWPWISKRMLSPACLAPLVILPLLLASPQSVFKPQICHSWTSWPAAQNPPK